MPEEIPQESKEIKPESDSGSISQIRTYQGDIANALNNQNESLVSIQRAEVTRRRSSGNEKAPEHTGRQRAVLLAIGTIVLIILTTFGGWFTYREYVKKSTPPISVIPESRLISSAEENSFNIATTTSRANLIKSLRDASTNTPLNNVRNIVLRAEVDANASLITIETFLEILRSDAPGSLVRSFEPVFMFGSLGGETASNFMIIRLVSFENAYAGMLSWERDIANDIGPIFPSAERLRNVISLTDFQDLTTKNKDIRVLYDPDGQEVLLYSFLNNDILIITDNIQTLHTVISRLTAESLVR